MADFLSAYSIQNWLESCPQGYLEGTVYGHKPGESEIEILKTNPVLHEDAIRTTVQLVVGERCALAASSGLINSAPDEASKRFLATQTLDEARHVEIFTHRLYDLGVRKDALEATIKEYANPNLVKFAGVLLEKVDKKDFVAGVVGQNIVLEGHGLQRVRDDVRHESGDESEIRPHALRHDRRRAAPRRLRREPHRVAHQGASRSQARHRADAEGHVVLHARDLRRRLPQQRRRSPSSSGSARSAATAASTAPTSARSTRRRWSICSRRRF